MLQFEYLLLRYATEPLQFMIVDNGVARNWGTSEEIPVSHLEYLRMPSDGLYKIDGATCGANSGCFVGDRNKSCTMYSPNKCAVYYHDQVDTESLSPLKFMSLLEGRKFQMLKLLDITVFQPEEEE